MLKFFITSLALTVGLIAQPSMASETKTVSVEFLCVKLNKLTEILAKYGEEPMMTMTSARDLGGKKIINPAVFFINTKTRTWTLAEKFGNDYYCVVGLGDGIKPFVSEENKKVM